MDIERKLELFAEVLDLDVDEIILDKKLEEYDEWDSVAVLSYIAMMDEKFGKEIKGAEIKEFVTVQDALNAME